MKHRTLSGANPLGQSRPGSDGNEAVFYIPQSSSITATSLSDFSVSYPGVLPICREAVGVLYCSSRLGKPMSECVCVCVCLNSEISFSKIGYQLGLKSPVFPTIYPLVLGRGKRNRLMHFSRALTRKKLQNTSSKIWTLVTKTIFHVDSRRKINKFKNDS